MIFVSNPGSLLLVFIVVLGALLPVSCLPAIGEEDMDPLVSMMSLSKSVGAQQETGQASTERALVRSRHGHGGQPEVLSTNEGTEQSKSATSQLTEMQAYATEASEPKMNAEDRKQVLKQSHAAQTTTEIQQQGIDTSQHKDKEDPEDLEQVLKRVQEIQNSKQAKAKSEMENHADEPSSIWKQITAFIQNKRGQSTSATIIIGVMVSVGAIVLIISVTVTYKWWRQPSTKAYGRGLWLPQKQHPKQSLGGPAAGVGAEQLRGCFKSVSKSNFDQSQDPKVTSREELSAAPPADTSQSRDL